jgi:eukaryotic-like serine/threonine-protein kinase
MQTGTRLGPYEIQSLLGKGGMGEVYRGTDTRLRRPVAIKVLAPSLVQDADALARFRREAETASALNHPNILTIYDIGAVTLEPHSHETHYIAMELVEGMTLRAAMNSGHQPSELFARLTEVATALAKAHEHGIIHRDLKPENIMLTVDGYAKVLDFGLAKLLHPTSEQHDETVVREFESERGVVLGTAAYMSPEQAAGKPCDHRSDVFSFGCIAYELLTGRAPFAGDSKVETLYQVIHGEPLPMRELDATISERLERIVSKCLHKLPERRYQSTRDLALDLAAAAGDAPAAVRSRRRTIPTRSTPSREPSIAVLPFDDLSPGKDHEYISHGLAEEILTDLSRLSSLRVIARTSSMQYRETAKSPRDIGAELGVEFILSGSVRRAGDRLRVSVQLVRADEERQIWADRFDGGMDDIFDIQETVARGVAEEIRGKLNADESDRIRQREISDVHAFESYLRARRLIWSFSKPSLDQALREIEDAIAIAGEKPLLLASKGYILWQYYNAGIDPDPAWLDRAQEIARSVSEREPGSPQAELLFGLVAVHRSDPRTALAHLERVLEVDPNEIETLTWVAMLQAFLGQYESSLAHFRRLREIDPLSWMSRLGLAACHSMGGSVDKAVATLDDLRPEDLEVPIVSFVVVQILTMAGEIERARGFLETLPASAGDQPFAKLARLLVAALDGRAAEVREGLTEDLLEMAAADFQYASWIAEIAAVNGDHEMALEWLERAVTRGFCNWPFFAHYDRFLLPLHGDDRFRSLMQRVHDEWRSIGT